MVLEEILAELYSIIDAPPWSKFDRTVGVRAAMVYMAANSIQKKDLWSPITKIDLTGYFETLGYTEDDLNKTIMANSAIFKRGQDVLKEIGGKSVWVPIYESTLKIRLLAKAYLELHSELKNAVVV